MKTKLKFRVDSQSDNRNTSHSGKKGQLRTIHRMINQRWLLKKNDSETRGKAIKTQNEVALTVLVHCL